ncbi:hypothetical protein Moror_3943 [Moniliophthora roreri MCA 2997]|uniref:C2H2-type domain-containing protein n=2 Tax=Moniliophthora roreri TaxID=221103 RepID=V2XR31_MONRO|nr:hypothetical protein Moror_3943 [Moniliophthora roreri MCA 2997]KAI3600960.1 hypothetical protein WG66_014835 [Moniliophthora roreri]
MSDNGIDDTNICINIEDTESQHLVVTYGENASSDTSFLTEPFQYPDFQSFDSPYVPYPDGIHAQAPNSPLSPLPFDLSVLTVHSDTPSSGPNSPHSPFTLDFPPSSSGDEASDGSSLYSLEHPNKSPVAHSPGGFWHNRDGLAVPPSLRGRSLQRNRSAPYGSRRSNRSISNASSHSFDSSDSPCIRMPEPTHYGRPRSLSVASATSSFNGYSSDNDGSSFSFSPYDTLPSPFSREHSPASSHLSDVDGSPLVLDVSSSASDHESGPSAHPSNYRSRVGSQAILNASASRRRKAAKFFCEEPGCPASFTTAQNLLHHKNSHAGIKPFACKYAFVGCLKTFGTPHVANRHSNSCPKNPDNKQKRSGNLSMKASTYRQHHL